MGTPGDGGDANGFADGCVGVAGGANGGAETIVLSTAIPANGSAEGWPGGGPKGFADGWVGVAGGATGGAAGCGTGWGGAAGAAADAGGRTANVVAHLEQRTETPDGPTFSSGSLNFVLQDGHSMTTNVGDYRREGRALAIDPRGTVQCVILSSALRKPNARRRSPPVSREAAPRLALAPETLVALAPAAHHLLRAVSEVIAAAQAAFDALPPETRQRSRWSIRSARAALDLVGRLALAGAERARRQSRETLKAETAREILAALDVRAARMDGRAADALLTVREAVRSALGGSSERPLPLAPRKPARAKRRVRRIPPVSFEAEDAGDEGTKPTGGSRAPGTRE